MSDADKFKPVSREELEAFVASYPRKLHCDACGICDPPAVSFNDFTLGKWPESIVAKYVGEFSGEPAYGFAILSGEPMSAQGGKDGAVVSEEQGRRLTYVGGLGDGDTGLFRDDIGAFSYVLQSIDPSRSLVEWYKRDPDNPDILIPVTPTSE